MITSFADVAAFVLPICAAAVAVRPHATALGTAWAGSTFGTTDGQAKRITTTYDDPQSRGSTG